MEKQLLICEGHRAWLDAQCRVSRAALDGIARMNLEDDFMPEGAAPHVQRLLGVN